MQPDELDAILTFLRSVERLKTVVRSGWTSAGQQESVAEHTWRLTLMAMVFYGRNSDIDGARLLKMCLIHDLGEAVSGDIPAPAQQPDAPKSARERADLVQLISSLPASVQEEILSLWDEYEAATSVEARLAKGLDKLETILQHTQGSNPPDFDYTFNLAYGRQYTSTDPLLSAIRSILDQETVRRGETSSRHS